MIKCVLFDSDGTLVDSELLSCQAIAIKFGELGVNLDTNDLLINARGKKMSLVLDTLSRENELLLDERFMPEYRALTAQLFQKHLKPIDGIIDMLNKLTLPRAVVSNGPPEKIHKALEVCGLKHYFGDNIYSAYELNCWKPDPKLYTGAAEGMGFAPEHCVVVEDTLVGVEAGVNAGMPTVFYNVLNEHCAYDHVYQIKHMNELLSCLDKIHSSSI